jgi:hypothetical protein
MKYNENMSFQIFQAAGTRNRPFISVTENKTFGLSRAFLDKHNITKDHKAVILFDPDTNQVALHFSRLNPSFGYSIQMSNKRHGAIIAARSFFESRIPQSKKYASRYEDYKISSLKSLGLQNTGVAYVIELKEKAVQTPPIDESKVVEDVAVEDVGDETVDLDDLPW